MECSGPLSALNSPSLDLSAGGDPTLGTRASVESSDFLLSAGRTLEETTKKISEYTAMLEEAAKSAPALEATSRLSSYSNIVKGGASSLDFDGALSGVKVSLQSTTDVLQSANDALNPEKFLSAQQSVVDGIGQQFSSQESIVKFWQWYVAALNERYHLSDFHQSLLRGTALTHAMNKVTAVGESAVNALDIKHQGPIYLFLVAVFWASTRVGAGITSDQPETVDSGSSDKLLAAQKIKNLEAELKTTKAAAKKESQEKSNEIKELRQQMVCYVSMIDLDGTMFSFYIMLYSRGWGDKFFCGFPYLTCMSTSISGYAAVTGRGTDRSSRSLDSAIGKGECPRDGYGRRTS